MRGLSAENVNKKVLLLRSVLIGANLRQKRFSSVLLRVPLWFKVLVSITAAWLGRMLVETAPSRYAG
jgi:hypothetical protein